MSIELRKTPDGYDIECDWGIIGSSWPLRHHLMLITPGYASQLLSSGPMPIPRGGTASASSDGDRVFVHLDYNGQRWTWELFEAHWRDGEGPEIYIGRWPD